MKGNTALRVSSGMSPRKVGAPLPTYSWGGFTPASTSASSRRGELSDIPLGPPGSSLYPCFALDPASAWHPARRSNPPTLSSHWVVPVRVHHRTLSHQRVLFWESYGTGSGLGSDRPGR